MTTLPHGHDADDSHTPNETSEAKVLRLLAELEGAASEGGMSYRILIVRPIGSPFGPAVRMMRERIQPKPKPEERKLADAEPDSYWVPMWDKDGTFLGFHNPVTGEIDWFNEK